MCRQVAEKVDIVELPTQEPAALDKPDMDVADQHRAEVDDHLGVTAKVLIRRHYRTVAPRVKSFIRKPESGRKTGLMELARHWAIYH